jgi:hypothetical protein
MGGMIVSIGAFGTGTRSGCVAACFMVIAAVGGHAQTAPPPPSAPKPPPSQALRAVAGFVSRYEVMRTVRAAGFDPLALPLREGRTYVLRATDFRGILMRVVVDARTGVIRDVNRIVPGPGSYDEIDAAPPTYGPPRGYYGAPSSYYGAPPPYDSAPPPYYGAPPPYYGAPPPYYSAPPRYGLPIYEPLNPQPGSEVQPSSRVPALHHVPRSTALTPPPPPLPRPRPAALASLKPTGGVSVAAPTKRKDVGTRVGAAARAAKAAAKSNPSHATKTTAPSVPPVVPNKEPAAAQIPN